MPRLLIDFTLLYIAAAFLMATLASFLGAQSSSSGTVAIIIAVFVAGQYHVKRGGAKLEPKAAWLFGCGAGLIVYALSFVQMAAILALSPPPTPEQWAATADIRNAMFVVLFFISIGTIFAGRYFINVSINITARQMTKHSDQTTH